MRIRWSPESTWFLQIFRIQGSSRPCKLWFLILVLCPPNKAAPAAWTFQSAGKNPFQTSGPSRRKSYQVQTSKWSSAHGIDVTEWIGRYNLTEDEGSSTGGVIKSTVKQQPVPDSQITLHRRWYQNPSTLGLFSLKFINQICSDGWVLLLNRRSWPNPSGLA